MTKEITVKVIGTHTNPALDAYIGSRHSELVAKAELLGKTLAIQNLIQEGTSLSVITEPLRAEYNQLNAEANKKNEGFLSIAQGKLEIDALEIENGVLRLAIEKVRIKISNEKHRIGDVLVPTVSHRRLIFGLVLSGFTLFSDSYFLGTAFQVSGSGQLVSLLLGTGMAVTIASISTLGTHQVLKIQSRTMRTVLITGLAILVTLTVYILCTMREQFYKAQTGQEMGVGSLTILTLISFIAFHVIYKGLIYPVVTKSRERQEALDKLQNLRNLETESDRLENVVSDNHKKIQEIKTFRLSVLAYSKSLEISITQMYRASIAAFKKAYIEEAAFIPACFSQGVPGLHTFYHDVNITKNPSTNEKDS